MSSIFLFFYSTTYFTGFSYKDALPFINHKIPYFKMGAGNILAKDKKY